MTEAMQYQFREGPDELIRFCPNGEIYVRGKLATTDQELAEGLRLMAQFYMSQATADSSPTP